MEQASNADDAEKRNTFAERTELRKSHFVHACEKFLPAPAWHTKTFSQLCRTTFSEPWLC